MRGIVGNHGDKRGMRRLFKEKTKKVMRKEIRTGGSIYRAMAAMMEL
jgi:hypothetical protein